MMTFRKYGAKVLLVAVSFFLAIFFVEILLRVFTEWGVIPSYKTVDKTEDIYDEKLLYRIPPRALPEIDANGFRNPAVPERVDIVGIGDSMTYGYNAASEDSWVYQLGKKTGKSVYSVSIGGGDPPQYLVLLDEALALDPPIVIVGFFAGNDVAGSCFVFWTSEYWRTYAEERGVDIKECLKASNDFWQVVQGQEKSANFFQSAKNLYASLKEESYIISFIKNISVVREAVWRMRAVKLAESNNDLYLIDDKNVRVLFDFSRNNLIDRNEAVTENAYEIAKNMFSEMRKKIGHDRRFIVLLLPTKENAYYDFLVENGYPVPEKYVAYVQNERTLFADFSVYASGLGIEMVDALSYYERKITEKNPPLYLEYKRDQHPTKTGYEAAAEAVAEYLIIAP